jgi:uncharacterized protein (TIGR02145 family)
MKKITIIMFLTFVVLNIQAQDYMIGFAGAGDTNVVSSVKVDNLTSGDTATLNGGDILHLIGGMGIGAPDIENGILKIYPNPMAEQSILTFVAPETGNVVICIIDISGRTVHQISTLLSPGAYNFCISGISQGLYVVKVSGKNYHYSTKLLSQSNLQSETGIEYVSSVKNTSGNTLKSTVATIDMSYTEGDILMFKGIAGPYTSIVTDVPTSSKTITFDFVLCKDNDGNNYATLKIDTLTWMAENLRATHYHNGESILNVTDHDVWEGLATGARCYYNNDSATYDPVYGALYNWYAVNDSRNLCPTGWYVPTDVEWTTLTDSLGGSDVAGGKMKSIGTIEAGTGLWSAPNTGATNESGFSALPGGYRYDNGEFNGVGDNGHWWSATQSSANYAWYRDVSYHFAGVSRGSLSKNFGYSVRCVKN